MAEQNFKKNQTKKKIYQALIKLSKIKFIRDVTVSELCRTASINRSTFYLHYQDIDDLILELRERNIYFFIESVKDKKLYPSSIDLSGNQTVFIDYKDLVEAIKHAENEKEVVMMLLGKHGDPHFATELKNAIRELLSYFLQDYYPQLKSKFPDVPEDYLSIILFDTSAEIILYWMEKGMEESPEKISEIISSARIVGPLSLL
ncbi:TetR/AcrR family transcriptional regulator [Enterococcus canis]|nr:TetR-like C-terminal domain-containing protein [Enterococcus canis]